MKIIIIDDETPARDLIKFYLKGVAGAELVAECANGFEGLRAIQEHQPDLILLDIQMPKINGFELLELIEDKPMVIFATAYDEFAIRAFEQSAVDYLLKPYTQERFVSAIQKAVARKSEKPDSGKQNIQKLMETLDNEPIVLDRVAVKSGSKIHVVPIHEVVYFESDGDYVSIVTNAHKYLKEKTMKYFEASLDPGQFVRIHRSYIVNINHISRIELYDKDSYLVFLKNDKKLKASAQGYKLLKKTLNY